MGIVLGWKLENTEVVLDKYLVRVNCESHGDGAREYLDATNQRVHGGEYINIG